MRRDRSSAAVIPASLRRGPSRSGVIVTGASGGIGRAISLAFAESGWYVGVHYNQGKRAAEATLKLVRTVGGDGLLYQADIRDARAVQQMVEAFCLDTSDISVFVCNAGIGVSRLVLRQSEEDWSSILATNLTGAFHCLRAIGSVLVSRGGGSIVVIGSHGGFQGATGQAAYAASKAGLVGLIKTAAREWGASNVRVNLLLPGWHKTALSEKAMPDDSEWADHALRRPPMIDEVARTVVHLARLRDVSGQIWNCDSRNL